MLSSSDELLIQQADDEPMSWFSAFIHLINKWINKKNISDKQDGVAGFKWTQI